MRVLRVHTDQADATLADDLGTAFERFNRGLDVRLRFLAIGIEDHVLRPTSAEAAPAEVETALAEIRPELVLIAGTGPAAVAVAAVAARLRARPVRLGAGRRDAAHGDYDRAVDRVCIWRLCFGDDDLARLADEGLDDHASVVGHPRTDGMGDRVVDALSRIRRSKLGED